MIGMEKLKSKVSFTIGVITALTAYSFWDILWYNSFYHLISVSFVCYTFTIMNECKQLIWKRLSFIAFICACNALLDEIKGTPCVVDFTEYLSVTTIILVIFVRKKHKTKL